MRAAIAASLGVCFNILVGRVVASTFFEGSRGTLPLKDFGTSNGRGVRDSPKRDLGSVGASGFALLDQEDEARDQEFAKAGRRKAGMVADGVDCRALAAPLLFDSMALDVLEQMLLKN